MSLTWLMLAVSAASLALQAAAAHHLVRQQAATATEQIAGGGYVRTVASRVGVACVYVTVAALQACGVRVPGSGGLSPESLLVFSVVQLVWLANSGLDIMLRHRLAGQGKPGR